MAAAGMALDQRRAARIDGDRAIAGGLDAHEWAPGTGAPGAAGSTVGIATLPTAGETIRIVRPRRVVWGAVNWRTRTINRNVMISSKNATMISAVRSAGNDASGSWVTIAEGIVVAPEVRSGGTRAVMLPITIWTAIVSPTARPMPRIRAVSKPDLDETSR